MRCYVIGDIHGCLEETAYLLEALPLELSDRLVFLGDYVDRGPNSKGVVSYLLKWRRERKQEMVFLKGNHEDMFFSFLGLGGNYGDMFLFNGGQTTLTSYGIPSRKSPTEMISRIPKSHLDFFKTLKPYYLMGSFLCVHAGIHPLKPLGEQVEKEMFWIRDEFIYNPHPLPYTVLYGHTPQREVYFDLPYKIGLDTGLVYGNRLSCLEVTERRLFQVKRGKKEVEQRSVKSEWERAVPSPEP